MRTQIAGSNEMAGSAVTRHATVRKVLLICGVVSVPLYIATDILGALRWEGYSYIDGPVSELIAIGAPTRPLVGALMLIYGILAIAFGLGVWGSAGRKPALRVVGGALIAKEVIGSLVVLLAPIHLARGRGNAFRYHARPPHNGRWFLLPDRHGVRCCGIRKAVPPVFHRDIADPPRVWRSRRSECFPVWGKSAYAVDGRMGARQHLRHHAMDRGAGRCSLARDGTPPGEQLAA